MENLSSADQSKADTRRRGVRSWLLGREPRIIDYMVIGVIVPLLVAGVLWTIGFAAGSDGTSSKHRPPGQKPVSGEGVKTQDKDTAGLAMPVYLDDLPKENGSPVTLGPVSIGGHVYEHGIEVNVNWIETQWEASYAIPHGAHTFSAIIGSDDDQADDLWASMSLLYEVLADGHLVGSGHAKGYSHDGPIHAVVAGKVTITLRVKVVAGLNSTKADWAEPVFH
ncbi:MAG: NPCBM/NEW2 domain-containing protein [Solirubrobacteraceae bacterium]